MHKKTTIRLEVSGRRADITVELRPGQVVEPKLTTDLTAITSYTELSISAQLWQGTREYSAGQCHDLILEWFTQGLDDQRHAALAALIKIWERWHLNGMRAGTSKQIAALEDCEHTDYVKRCEHLEKKGLLIDDRREVPVDTREPGTTAWTVGYTIGQDLRPQGPEFYKYGSAWLVEELPSEVIHQLSVCCRVLGAELGDPDDAMEPPSPLDELCEKHGLTLEYTFVGVERGDTANGNWEHRHFIVDVVRGSSGVHAIDYRQGMAHTKPPTVAEVVSLLVDEVSIGETSFEDFCDEHGQSCDSRMALETWETCKGRAPAVRALLGDEFDQFAGADH